MLAQGLELLAHLALLQVLELVQGGVQGLELGLVQGPGLGALLLLPQLVQELELRLVLVLEPSLVQVRELL